MARTFSGSASNYLGASATPITGFPLSFFCWYYPQQATAQEFLISLGDTGTNNNYFALFYKGDVVGDPMAIGGANSAGAVRVESTTAPTQNAWNAVGGSASSNAASGMKIYVNGASGSTTSVDAMTAFPSSVDAVGVGILNRLSVAAPVLGRLAHVAVWNAVLTASEWAALSARFDPRSVRPQSLKLYAPLDGSSVGNDRDIVGGVTLVETGAVGAAESPMLTLRASPIFVRGQPSGVTRTASAVAAAHHAAASGSASHVLTASAVAAAHHAAASGSASHVLTASAVAAAHHAAADGSASVTETADRNASGAVTVHHAAASAVATVTINASAVAAAHHAAADAAASVTLTADRNASGVVAVQHAAASASAAVSPTVAKVASGAVAAHHIAATGKAAVVTVSASLALDLLDDLDLVFYGSQVVDFAEPVVGPRGSVLALVEAGHTQAGADIDVSMLTPTMRTRDADSMPQGATVSARGQNWKVIDRQPTGRGEVIHVLRRIL